MGMKTNRRERLTLLFLFVIEFSAKRQHQILANGIKSLCFFLGGLVLVVKLVFLFDELLYITLQRLMARQLLQSLGIKVAFGGVKNDEVAVMFITIFLASFLIFAGFHFVDYICQLYKTYELRALSTPYINNVGTKNHFFPYTETQFFEFDKYLFANWHRDWTIPTL